MPSTEERAFSRSAQAHSVLVTGGSVEDASPSTGEEFEDPEVVATPTDPGLCAESSDPLLSSARARLPSPSSVSG